jgi:hypothetical protein
MKHVKTFLKAVVGFIILIVLYTIYTADRIIKAPTLFFQFSFKDWAELNKDERIRTYTDVYKSLTRVIIVSLIIWLIWLFK